MHQENLITYELPGRTLRSAYQEYLYFSGTSYLGIGHNQAFNAYLQEGLKRYGTNYSSSRLSNVQLAIFEEAETYLAAYTGAEAALTISSGFLAGQLVVQALAGTGNFWYSPGTHPALCLNVSPPGAKNYDEWVQQVPGLISEAKSDNHFILFNAIDPLYAKKHSLDWLQELLTLNKNITLIVDDSHGFGVTGQSGAGVFKEITLPAPVRKIVVSSLGKALGIPGGVILSDNVTVQALKKSSFFGGGSPVIPAYLYGFLRAPEIYQQARAQLLNNIQYFISQLNQPRLFSYFAHYPVFYTPHNQLYNYLLNHNILISSFSYPTPAHDPITRVILSSLHTQNDIDTLAAGINKFCAETNLSAKVAK